MRRKILTSLLTLSMVLSGMPAGASAARNADQTVTVDGVNYTITTLERGAAPADGQTQIGGTSYAYQGTVASGTYYGTSTLTYSEFYENETSVEEYDIVSSATTGKKKNMKKAVIVNVKSSKTSVVLKKLKPQKIYYVQVRAYKKSSGKKVYSKWTAVKKKKVKA